MGKPPAPPNPAQEPEAQEPKESGWKHEDYKEEANKRIKAAKDRIEREAKKKARPETNDIARSAKAGSRAMDKSEGAESERLRSEMNSEELAKDDERNMQRDMRQLDDRNKAPKDDEDEPSEDKETQEPS
ncbi:hypothetical protein K491DRAFT_719214 [Lophiostoma macrostomum CBS 122681]|uniref:Uncharacterized protein n=1 Tax=Lophiostoma macrostomum CBS 122681 TaxID=1314788 RepID=A0A6A6SWY2_9PLEO|nr:hypothetical protein K491DRAFT_719214 [Lophiostoma macrostomum CBS 122681]